MLKPVETFIINIITHVKNAFMHVKHAKTNILALNVMINIF